jgi:hypothetical protein
MCEKQYSNRNIFAVKHSIGNVEISTDSEMVEYNTLWKQLDWWGSHCGTWSAWSLWGRPWGKWRGCYCRPFLHMQLHTVTTLSSAMQPLEYNFQLLICSFD